MNGIDFLTDDDLLLFGCILKLFLRSTSNQNNL